MKKTTPVSVWVGTRKGAFRFRSTNRKTWDVDGPHFKGWEVNHVAQDPRDPKRLYAAVNSAWFGPHIHASVNDGKTWKPSDNGFEVKSVPDAKLARAWHIEPGHADQPGVVWAGGDPGVLFRSEDWGKNWQEVTSLNTHASRSLWTAGGGGLMVHSIQCLSKDSVIVGISAAGAFRTNDGGATWTPHNAGVRADFLPKKFPEVGQCVHHLVAHPRNPEMLFQQNHCGVYRAKADASKWTDISRGLPTRFGFCMAVAADEPETVFTVPIEGPEFRCVPKAQLQVGRSRDGGKTWKLVGKGLPQKNAYVLVLREAMASDDRSPSGVYFGTTGGHVYYTRDAGDSWQALAEHLPPVYSVSVA
jgi:photosystem II stability/assembly factor-like uncharacterized protein